MKKISLVSLISMIFLFASSICAYYLRYMNIASQWFYVVVGVVILFISGILAFAIKKSKVINVICMLMCSIALGFLIRGWYIFRGFDNALWVMLLVSFTCVIYLWIFYLLLYIPFFDKHYVAFTIIFIIVSLITYIIVVACSKTTYISTFGYYMIVEIAFIVGLCMKSRTYSELIRNMVLCSYSVFIVAIIIVLLMLAGDGADFDFDFDFGGGGDIDTSGTNSPKNKKVVNDFETRI